MHIPQATTNTLTLELFEPALKPLCFPLPIMTSAAGCMCPTATRNTVIFWAPAVNAP